MTVQTEVINTGERILLEKESAMMITRHLCAYSFASAYVRNKSVLDIGCGEGYGANYLSKNAKAVLGIDYDKAITEYANQKYRKDNLVFLHKDARELEKLDKKFDVICCFQVIEHIVDPDKFLRDVNNLLSEGGLFICSTPNKNDASPNSNLPLNKFHFKEYLYPEFKGLLARHFKEVKIRGLKRSWKFIFYRLLKKGGIFNFLPQHMNPVLRFYGRIDCGKFVIMKNRPWKALDFISVCSNKT